MSDQPTELAALIHQVRGMKGGNREFALFSESDGMWTAMLGNLDCGMCWLGEGRPEFRSEGWSPEEAVAALVAALTAPAPVNP